MHPDRDYAVVTGASRGLGRAFAELLAARGWNLLLVSLPGEGLALVAKELGDRHGVTAFVVEADLTHEEGREAVLHALEKPERPIRLLVNNAGIGDNGLFDRLPLSAQRKAVELNIQATMALTYGLLPALAAAAPARILTVASLAAFQPMPLFAVYAASKAFLLHWGLALHHELKPLGVGFTVLAPGGIYTNEANREKTRSQGLAGRLSTQEPEIVAKIALKATERGTAIVIPGFFNRLLTVLGAIVPRNFKAWAVHRRWQKALSKVKNAEDCRYYRREAGRETSLDRSA